MCNPPDKNNDVISTCNVTGLWDIHVERLKRACELHAMSHNAAPYKNVFCLLCNRNNSHSSQYFDVYIDWMSENMFAQDQKLTFVYSFSLKSYNLEFYNTIIESTKQEIFKREDPIWDKARSVNISKLLLYDFSVTGYYRYCRKHLVPYAVGKYPCSCNPLCFFDDALECCLDLVLEYPISCQRPSLSTEGPSNYLIDGCFQSSWPEAIQSRCRFSDNDIFSSMPIVGENNMLYKNFDCFLCNQDILIPQLNLSKIMSYDNYLPWSIDMQCEGDLNLLFHATFNGVIDATKRNRCITRVLSTKVKQGQSCKQDAFGFFSPIKIHNKQCNSTGYWEEFDQDIRWACENSSLENQYDFHRNTFCFICNPSSETNTTTLIQNCQSTDNKFYGAAIVRACREAPEVSSMFPAKNIFCQYCNINDTKIPLPWPIMFQMHTYFSKDVNFKPEVSSPVLQDLFRPFVNKLRRSEPDTNGTHVFDPITTRPRLLTCYPGKIIDGTQCVPLLRTTTNLKYIMTLSLEGTLDYFEQTVKLLTIIKKKILSEMKTKLAIRMLFIQSFHITSNVSCEIGNVTTPITHHLLIQTTFSILEVVERLATEQILLNMTRENLVISNVTFRSRPANEAYFLPSAPSSNFDDYCVKNFIFLNKVWTTLPSVRTALVSDVMLCRQVVLRNHEYSIKHDTLELSVKYSSRKFTRDRYLRMPDSNAQLCLDDYLGFINEYMANTENDPVRNALSVTTLVCTSVSLTCLFLTFGTYLLFRAMRSVPGVNNMSLVFAMFFSQGLFQFGFEETSVPSLCLSIGVITHYFWLATFTCMNVCSFHMYSVFAVNTLTGRSSNTRKQIALYLSYSYGIPLVVVAGNIITSYCVSFSDDVISGVTDIGYGGGVCFISNNISFYATFLAPVVLICIINMFMFVRVAIKIKNTPKVESTKDHRLDFVIYIKLFTITGLTWILVIIDTFLPLSVFSFIVTILTGCQGLLIFFSFVWNQRVFRLYRSLFCKTKHKQRPSTKYSSRSQETVASSM
ncbi:uncharacterized protein LOC132550309 [Ylistrum balloti]|uniref:uncharacterized protein LOC132550309 n=1 Tax=Ylistrum balloti TaxID=509963 RepID=UPI00290587E1|nr:uncharacterized protein LOC132550309 [Ylistrum balloti]